ncbi:CHASE2 and HATPase_c domain-containing protein [Variovorax sp.]|jgi:CHASE2 domain-containing sensor protein/signal transduction histidine kinase|uniref:CHASE2 and HATPase_c domain-containing protein n=2 Tax=Variovorax TaxID=34072 RepID=UPI0012051E4C|nr:CHASE2 and HATPase_c domain-containing protein [Variovorax sp.]TAJ60411.1 MAG: CHASE2 domain-containing protein [Variovorax sp.]
MPSTRLVVERLLMALLLPLAMLVLAQRPGLLQMDAFIHDRLLILASHTAAPEILIIAIDERSLGELGRWPWSREIHARLLERLAPAAPRAVLLDMFLTEPSTDPREDARLAEAMGLLPVYLPLLHAGAHAGPDALDEGTHPGFLAPLPRFAERARGLGHAGLAPDPDGVARTLYLREGYAGHLQPYVGALIAGRVPPPPSPEAGRPGDWLRQDPLRLVFAGPRGSYRTVPYVSVLRGEVPAELLRDKLLLVGATAPGLGDQTLTPNAGMRGVLPGIEVNANAIDDLMNARNVALLPPAGYAAWTVVPLWIALWLLVRLQRHALPIAFGLAVACLLASGIAMLGWHWWLPPAAPIAGLFLLYLLWSWRRLESQLAYLRQRARVLHAIPSGAFEVMPAPPALSGDPVVHPKQALDRAIARVQRMQKLMDEAMHAMPVAMLICDDQGRIASGNAAASRLLGGGELAQRDSDPDALRGLSLPQLIAPMTAAAKADAPGSARLHWTIRLRDEYTTADARVFRLEAAAFGADAPDDRGWVVMLPELTTEREAQRQRDEWRRFLSHDLRSPQVTILSLLSMHEGDPDAAGTADMRKAIRREAKRTLDLAEGFMDFAQAESDDYRFADTHVGAVLLDARDQAWHYAQANGVRIDARLDDADETLVRADGSLLTRAIVNLLNNAIRHSAPGARIELRMDLESATPDAAPDRVRITIADQGSGMTPAQLHALLHAPRGQRAQFAPEPVATPRADPDASAAAAPRRMGLGFAVVRAVVQKHGGQLGGESTPGTGTRFWLLLPLRRELR